MGCSSSKRVKSAVDVYRPPPSSFAVIDMNAIKEPWLSLDYDKSKPAHFPDNLIDKLHAFETTDAPRSWEEVSKALQDLKPDISKMHTQENSNKSLPASADASPPHFSKQQLHDRRPFHTLEELDAKLSSPKLKTVAELRKSEAMRNGSRPNEERNVEETRGNDSVGFKSLKENAFIVRDRLEREKEGKQAKFETLAASRNDPLSEFPEKRPPNGGDALVIYTTSLRGVRRTYEDCARAKGILEGQHVVFDERDVALHGEFLRELKELLGETASVPRVFVKGRYVGGVEDLSELNESGKLGRILSQARVERAVGRQACEGCGGARFVPCLDCGGSCKVVVAGGKRERCGRCNENGLVLCPACL